MTNTTVSNRTVKQLTLPDGEFKTNDLVALNTSMSRASVVNKLNSMVLAGEVKITRSESNGRGRPAQVFSRA